MSGRVKLRAMAAVAMLVPLPPAFAADKALPTASPQQTTATFGNWTLRCVRPTGAAKLCEVMQLVQQDGKAVAQIAVGSVAKGQPMRLTMLVPPSVTLGTAPQLMAAGGAGAGVGMTWRRCLPGGCIADGEVGAEALLRIQAWTQPGRIVFADGADRPVVMPFAPQGLVQALEALAAESAQ